MNIFLLRNDSCSVKENLWSIFVVRMKTNCYLEYFYTLSCLVCQIDCLQNSQDVSEFLSNVYIYIQFYV